MDKTTKREIRNLSKDQYLTLKDMCHLSKNVYNTTLYNIKQYYKKTEKYLRYESNYHLMKNDKNFKYLFSHCSQHTMMIVDYNYQSFFSLIKKDKNNINEINPPKYLDKNGYFLLIFPQFKINKDGYINLPMNPKFRKDHNNIKIMIKVPDRLKDKKIKEMRIYPKYNAKYFEAHFIYLDEEQIKEVDKKQYLSIDLGLDNFATCISTIGSPFIIDGRKIKSYNQWYNKYNAKLQSIKDKQKTTGITNKQINIVKKRNNRVSDFMFKSARYVINYCLDNKIGNIVIGYNLEMKTEINLGKKNNQNFVFIPHASFRNKLKYLCKFYGISYIEQEESYTSKASFIDKDPIPIIDFNNFDEKFKFSGKRIKRGLYKSKNGTLINSDINGSYNILVKHLIKSKQKIMDQLYSGCLGQPVKIRVH